MSNFHTVQSDQTSTGAMLRRYLPEVRGWEGRLEVARGTRKRLKVSALPDALSLGLGQTAPFKADADWAAERPPALNEASHL